MLFDFFVTPPHRLSPSVTLKARALSNGIQLLDLTVATARGADVSVSCGRFCRSQKKVGKSLEDFSQPPQRDHAGGLQVADPRDRTSLDRGLHPVQRPARQFHQDHPLHRAGFPKAEAIVPLTLPAPARLGLVLALLAVLFAAALALGRSGTAGSAPLMPTRLSPPASTEVIAAPPSSVSLPGLRPAPKPAPRPAVSHSSSGSSGGAVTPSAPSTPAPSPSPPTGSAARHPPAAAEGDRAPGRAARAALGRAGAEA